MFYKHIKSKKTPTPVLLGLVGCFMFAVMAFSFAFAGSAFALSGDALNKKAEQACGKGDDPRISACRNGYREAHSTDKTKEQACGSQRERGAYDTPQEKNSCLRGYELGKALGKSQCGKGSSTIQTKFDFGCLGESYTGTQIGPIEDLAYALIRFLSAGVGVVLVIGVIWSGIQYSSSEGNPEATQAAKSRIMSVFIGLMIYIFSFSLLQYLVPGGLFNSGVTAPSNVATLITDKGNL